MKIKSNLRAGASSRICGGGSGGRVTGGCTGGGRILPQPV
jgi:hypothetical protein